VEVGIRDEPGTTGAVPERCREPLHLDIAGVHDDPRYRRRNLERNDALRCRGAIDGFAEGRSVRACFCRDRGRRAVE